jgi:predicted acyl esterase
VVPRVHILLCACLIAAGASAEAIRIKEAWIAMPDGVRLSADLYLPGREDATTGKLPVLLEYLPYRKHEARSRNYPLYSYFVERGYAVAAVYIRGRVNRVGRLIPHFYSLM